MLSEESLEDIKEVLFYINLLLNKFLKIFLIIFLNLFPILISLNYIFKRYFPHAKRISKFHCIKGKIIAFHHLNSYDSFK